MNGKPIVPHLILSFKKRLFTLSVLLFRQSFHDLRRKLSNVTKLGIGVSQNQIYHKKTEMGQ